MKYAHKGGEDRFAIILGQHGGNVLYYRTDVAPHRDKVGNATHQRTFYLPEGVFFARYRRVV